MYFNLDELIYWKDNIYKLVDLPKTFQMPSFDVAWLDELFFNYIFPVTKKKLQSENVGVKYLAKKQQIARFQILMTWDGDQIMKSAKNTKFPQIK